MIRERCVLLVSTGRNEVLGERHDSRTYRLPSGRKIVVKTLSEMQYAPRPKTKA